MASRREKGGVLAESNGSAVADNFRGQPGRRKKRTEYKTQWSSSLPGTPPRGYGGSGRQRGEQGGRRAGVQGKRSGIDQELLCSELYRRERKKSSPVSLTHLLNFTMAPRPQQQSPRAQGGGGGWRGKRYPHWHNKEQFVQANCQFVVRADGDYLIHSTDPDRLVEWSCVEQVRLFCHEIPSCPICLYPPTAAKITRCGHVYCSSCVLHYLALGEKKWRKCPICYESIYSKDLRSVTTQTSHRVCVGDSIEMQLMIRKKGSTVALPISKYQEEGGLTGLPALNAGEWTRYSKLLTASSSQIEEFIETEKRELLKQATKLDTSEELERCFIESALDSLRVREEEMRKGNYSTETPEDTSAIPLVDETLLDASSSTLDADCLSSAEDEENTDQVANGKTSSPRIGDYDHPDSIIFYQATDGQHLYLHPINTKSLLKEYGGWESCPHVINATVLEMEQFSMTEEVRGRYRHLSHLPLTCEFALCELDLQPPIVSRKILSEFADNLQKRKQKRMRKKREERRREQRAPPNRSLSLPSNPSDISPEHLHDFLSLSSSPPLPSSLPRTPPVSVPPSFDEGTREQTISSTPSFAQALASGEKRSVEVPRSTGASPIQGAPSPAPGEENDGDTAVPSFRDAFSDALLTASHSVMAAARDPGGKPGGGKTAKKSRKKLVLFTTGGTRRAI